MKRKTHLTVKDMQARFSVKKPDTVYAWAKRYADILQPMRIAGRLMFDPVNVRKFEQTMRVYK